jgi:hypothetical protein
VGSLAVLLTFSIELRSATRTELRRIIAVLLPVDGGASELVDPERWLRLATQDRPFWPGNAWRDLFADWVPRRQSEAEAIAGAAMRREVARLRLDHRRSSKRQAMELQDWLRRRADDICGAFVPRTGDLFGAADARPAWQSLREPVERLAAFTADPNNPLPQRREANSVIELFQRQQGEHAARAPLSAPILRPIGMLMLVPPAC